MKWKFLQQNEIYGTCSTLMNTGGNWKDYEFYLNVNNFRKEYQSCYPQIHETKE